MLCPDFVQRFFRAGGGCVRMCPWRPPGIPTSLSGTLPMYSKRTGERENRDFCKSPNLESWRQGGRCRVIIRARFVVLRGIVSGRPLWSDWRSPQVFPETSRDILNTLVSEKIGNRGVRYRCRIIMWEVSQKLSFRSLQDGTVSSFLIQKRFYPEIYIPIKFLAQF